MTRSIRRSPEQWQELVDQWRDSGQSATRFCETHGVGYSSFCNWRKRLADDQLPPTERETSFIDLSALPSAGEGRAWNIVLCLGNGVELRLSQG